MSTCMHHKFSCVIVHFGQDFKHDTGLSMCSTHMLVSGTGIMCQVCCRVMMSYQYQITHDNVTPVSDHA